MAYIEEVIRTLREDDPSRVKEGRRFEKFVKTALESHPGIFGQERFETIWFWRDWPDRQKHGYSAKDIGIDLVAKETQATGGGLVAIQVKFGDSEVSTAEVDSFLGASGTDFFTSRLIVSSREIAKIGLQELEKASPQCQILRTSEMDGWLSDWRIYLKDESQPLKIEFEKHELREYQDEAVLKIDKGFTEANKGQLIMPCGSGKSLVALHAAEKIAGANTDVLYLVPSIALMGQTMREWSQQRSLAMQYLGVCSDVTTGLKATDDASTAGNLTELAIPVTTDAEKVAEQLARKPLAGHIRVIFSTYHSTPKIAEALKSLPHFHFDLVICDEAHRTTGISEAHSKKDNIKGYHGISPFQLIHHNEHLPASKRLFMTATPRIFTDKQRKKIDEGIYEDEFSYSMDDPDRYGDEFFKMSFADALQADCLSDYEVIVIAADERSYLQSLEDSSLAHDDPGLKEMISTSAAVKLAGSWDALATPQTISFDRDRKPGELRPEWGAPARSAIAFCNTVRNSKQAALHWQKVAEAISGRHAAISDRYATGDFLGIDVRHLDSHTPANERADLLQRLRNLEALNPSSPRPTLIDVADIAPSNPSDSQNSTGSSTTCRVLTNARVLSEGVDVPALDAVVFLEPRSSELDITQAVGRVMRKAPGKQKGYIIIPVVIPVHEVDVEDEDARISHADKILSSSDFSAVWKVARALRSHDDRIDYWLNNPHTAKQTTTFRLRTTQFPSANRDTETNSASNGADTKVARDTFEQLSLALAQNFASMLVSKCGDRQLYPRWGEQAARICETIRQRVSVLISRAGGLPNASADAFDEFLSEIRLAVSPDVSYRQAEEMVAQHIVTIPVFDVLFSGSDFVSSNPVSISINKLIGIFEAQGGKFEEDLRPLKRAYQTMERAFQGAVSSQDKLDILREIYDGFFNAAMKKAVEALGIAYTPVELVDFIWRSVDAVCRREFGKGLTDEGVNILEPFVGTGTFISRLLTGKDSQGNYLIRDEDLARKYNHEIHANELILLAYYIAALKIEETKHSREQEANPNSQAKYEPFENIVLTDTFLMNENLAARASEMFERKDGNPERVQKQNQLSIQVIASNPPWSSGQDSASDDNPRTKYEAIAERVRETYSKIQKEITSRAPGGSAAGNTYVQAFRWASDRINGNQNPDNSQAIPEPAIISFVSPNSLYDGTSLAGMRKCMQSEFTDIYVVNLRGNAYKSGEERKKEGDNVFGNETRNGVQITVLVRNPQKDIDTPVALHYIEVPEYSNLDQKLEWLSELEDVLNPKFQFISTNERWSWSNPGTPGWENMLSLCPKKSGGNEDAIVSQHASGIKTNIDTYVYAFSRSEVEHKARVLIDEYNKTLALYIQDPTPEHLDELTKGHNVHCIKWTHALENTLKKQKLLTFDDSKIVQVLYRPFRKMWLYLEPDILSSTSVVKMFNAGGGAVRGSLGGDHLKPTSSLSQSNSYSMFTAAAGVEAFHSGDTDQHEFQQGPARRDGHHHDPRHAPDNDRHQDVAEISGGGQFSQKSATKSHSGLSRPSATPISQQPGAIQDAHPDDTDKLTIKPSHKRGRGNYSLTGSAFGGARTGNQSSAPISTPIAVTCPSNKAVFGVLATPIVTDLCAAGTQQASRLAHRHTLSNARSKH